MDKVKEYILDFALFSEEPLHIIFQALLDDKIIHNAHEAIKPILELIQEQYLDCYGNKYQEHNNLTKDELIEYIKIHEPQQFKEYPEPREGGEYYFKTTKKGMHLFPDEWKPSSPS